MLFRSQLAAKRIRLLGVTSDTRLAAFPDAPTIAEAGVPGYEYRGWVGVFAPTSTPKAIIDRLNGEIKKAIDSPDLKKRLEDFEPWTMSPAEMNARIKSDYEKYGRLMKLVGSKLDWSAAALHCQYSEERLVAFAQRAETDLEIGRAHV